MKNKTKKLGTILIVIGLILLAAACVLFAYNTIDDQRAETRAMEALEQVDNALWTEKMNEDEEEIPLYVRYPDMEMPTVKIDGLYYIGRLEIPSISLSLPVIDEWSYPNLKKSPCRYSGSAYKGNLTIAGHNYKSHFGPIKTLSEGATVQFTDMDNNVFNYVVSEVRQLQPTDIEAVKESEYPLTLFTCTLGGKFRVAVYCSEA
jgi:sortase A